METRNYSDQVIKQQVWGLMYIDEIIQIGLNDDPGEDDDGGAGGTQDNVEPATNSKSTPPNRKRA